MDECGAVHHRHILPVPVRTSFLHASACQCHQVGVTDRLRPLLAARLRRRKGRAQRARPVCVNDASERRPGLCSVTFKASASLADGSNNAASPCAGALRPVPLFRASDVDYKLENRGRTKVYAEGSLSDLVLGRLVSLD